MANDYRILKKIKLFDIYEYLNKENRGNDKAVALREIDLTEIDKLRMNSTSQKNTYSAFIIKAAAITIKEFPLANRILINWFFFKRMVQLNSANISIAVERNDLSSLEDYEAAFIYTVNHADTKKTNEISIEINGISSIPIDSSDPRIDRWKKMKLGINKTPILWPVKIVLWFHKNWPSSYLKNRGGALMISSPGKYGVDAIIAHWPYTIGLSFGLAKNRPWVVGDEVKVRKTFIVSIAFDRRIVSGSLAARFMNRLCERLENPTDLN